MNLEAASFLAEWRDIHSEIPPVGYLLRKGGAKHWVRFHALPESKRYPESVEEEHVVLGRAQALGEEVLGDGAECWLVQSGAPGPERPHDAFDARSRFGLEFICSFINHSQGWPVHAARVTWRRSVFDSLFIAVAHERAAPTLWFSPERRAVFAPYDGGFDLFLRSREEVSRQRHVHSSWLSGRHDCLYLLAE